MRFDWLISTGLGVTSALVLTLPAAATQLQSWQFNERENQLVFTTDTAVQPRAQMVFNPTRVVIDLPGSKLGRSSRRQAVGGAIREVRSGQFDAQTARLVIELAAGYTLDPRAVEIRGISSNQWSCSYQTQNNQPRPRPLRLPATAATPSPGIFRTRRRAFFQIL